jgi:thioester reductase-like protein
MEATNELACYRYAAVVHLASADLQHRIRHISNDSWIDAKAQNLDLHAMEALLDPISGPDTVAISNIPYSKIAFPRAIVEAVEGQQLDNMRNRNWLSKAGEHAATSISLSPLDLVELAQRLNYRIELSWARQSSQSGGLDAIFYRHDDLNGKPQRTLFCFPHDHSSRQYQSLTSKPLRQRAQGNALQRLKSSIESVLPRYMLPQSITILDQLPINRNGKVDRRKLAESFVTDQKTEETKQQPTKAMEREMQRIWSEVLNIKPDAIGLHDGFIQLGGNSLDAMRVVTMARHADMNLSVTDMFRHSVTSIYQLTLQLESAYEYESGSAARRVDPTHLITDIARCDARIAAVPLNLDQATGIENPRKLPTVLLTGANGFIGTQILRQLLEDNRVGRVIAIVRGDSAEAARGRLIDVAKKALWWTEFHDAPLEVWPGDLSLPRLGLDPSRWDPIQNGAIDIIIHNAAAVHFIKSYEALKPANVGSTVEMLCVASSNPRTKFVYVSSARHEDPTEEQEETVAKHLAANSNGYMQTKFVSEALVRRAALRNASGRNQFSIVSPGLVIGTLTEGYSNTDDWIWRLAAACVRVGMYNADNAATWIPISDVGTVARIIVETVMSSRSSSQPIVQIKGGLTLGDFWETLIGLGYELEGRSGSECATAIRQDIESAKEDHPLWTLSDVLGDLEDTAQDTWAASWYEEKTCPVRLRVAIQKTVRYLEGIGFL